MTTDVQTTPNISKDSRRRPFLSAAGLVARSLTAVIDLPGLYEPVRAVRHVATAFKAPKDNDARAQELVDRIDGILAQFKPLLGGAEFNEPNEHHPGYGIIIGKLEEIKEEITKIKFKSYATKLACHQEIELSLSRKELELNAVIQDVCEALTT